MGMQSKNTVLIALGSGVIIASIAIGAVIGLHDTGKQQGASTNSQAKEPALQPAAPA